MYIAHSENDAGQVHYLTEHSWGVARLAAQFAGKFAAGKFGYWAGLTHDIGKAGSFQGYIRNPDTHPRVEHSGAGALFAYRIWEGLGFPVAGHHGGLPDTAALKDRLQRGDTDPNTHTVINAVKKVLPELNSPPDLTRAFPAHLTTATSVELFIRLLFSALVDADFLDTEAHFEPMSTRLRGSNTDLDTLWRRLWENHQSLSAGKPGGPLNRVRQEIFGACCESANLPPGVFRLTAPTGGGKTRSGMAFALKHALRHSLDRVIVAIPYTSIIEQNADVYRGIFGDEAVLEHHSAIEPWNEHEGVSKAQIKARLATENWDSPIVVTTTVQLFESLFANRPARCRKLHNIVRSVIILDEVQTLPTDLLVPILDVLRDLTENYGVSVVLCTATQPALDDSPYLRGLHNVREIIPSPERYFNILKRVEYELPAGKGKWSWDKVASVMDDNPQSLAVVNTKRDALALISALDDPDALHLSTLLCGAHRRAVIARVKQRLRTGRPCRLVSTQVIEAGVDLDFPLVLRAVGPLDRIVQAAGRCNREGTLIDGAGHPAMGRVIVFEPQDGGSPRGAYLTGIHEATFLLRRDNADLHNPTLYKEYFRRLYRVVETDTYKVQPARESLNYETVAKHFRMIDDNTVPVAVRYEDEADQIIARVRATGITRGLTRRLQPYLVNVYQNEISHLLDQGLIEEIAPELYEWMGAYDSVTGITDRARDPETLVF